MLNIFLKNNCLKKITIFNNELKLCRNIIIFPRIKIMSRHNRNSEFLLCRGIILICRIIIMLRHNFDSLLKIVILLRLQLCFENLTLD